MPISVGSFTLSAFGTDTNGCVGSGQVQLVVDICEGVTYKESATNLLRIFPNPTRGEIVVTSGFESDAKVTDALGRTLLCIHLNAGSTVIPLTGLQNGIYLIETGATPFARTRIVLDKE
jgi:hypothetical protein